MGGLVVGYGSPNHVKREKMFQKMSHRGPYISGFSRSISDMVERWTQWGNGPSYKAIRNGLRPGGGTDV